MKRLVVILIALLLGQGCATQQTTFGGNRAEIQDKESYYTNHNMRVHHHYSLRSIQDEWVKLYPLSKRVPQSIGGWWQKVGGRDILHILVPSEASLADDLCTIGHEFAHILYGKWHIADRARGC